MNAVEKIYRCGDCPVCAFMGDLVLLEALGSGALFVFCPSCACALDGPVDRLDEIVGPEKYAPLGFVLPDRDQVRLAIDRGWRPRFLAGLDREWQRRLGAGFRARACSAPA